MAVFSPELLGLYQQYSFGQVAAEKAVVKCAQKYPNFETFLGVQQRLVKDRLDQLLPRPVRQVAAYHEALRRLVACLPPDHVVRPSARVANGR